VHFGGGCEASFCIFEKPLEKFERLFAKHLKRQWLPSNAHPHSALRNSE